MMGQNNLLAEKTSTPVGVPQDEAAGHADMRGKVCVVTGANNGFGLVTSRRLAALGATVLMVCRDGARGESARERVAEAAATRPELYLGDFLLQADVRRVASEIKARHPKVDVLVNNAGYAYAERELTSEGFERTFALNYLAYFTFTLELLPHLCRAEAPRIVNTASSSHRWREVSLDNLQGEKSFPRGRFPPLPIMYGWTNGYRIMFTYELADRLAKRGVNANCFCPGFVPVKRSSASGLQNALMGVAAKFVPSERTPEEAADTPLYLAASPAAAGLTGAYFESGKRTRSAAQTYDKSLHEALFERTLHLTGAVWTACKT